MTVRVFFALAALLGAVVLFAAPSKAAPTFREIFERHDMVMLLIDPDSGKIVDANPAAEQFYGYTRRQLTAMSIQDINQLSAEEVAAERALAKTEKRSYFIFRHRLANGDVRTVEVHSRPFAFEGKTVLYSFIVDISKQRAAEDALWHYQAQLEQMVDRQTLDIREHLGTEILYLYAISTLLLVTVVTLATLLWRIRKDGKRIQVLLEQAEQASRTKSEFLASMSHELRTPLNAVMGFAQMLQYDPHKQLDQTQNEYVSNILDASKHLLELINGILDLARIEADQVELSLEEIAPETVLDECLAIVSPMAAAHGVQLINTLVPGERLRTDPMRLKQVLLNLLSNAVKFNHAGGHVTVSSAVDGHGFMRISIADTGVGIAPDDHGVVFQLFQRVKADPMIAQEGTGIGLSVSKLLVEKMAGRIGFESQIEEGSVFWIELPLESNTDMVIWSEAMRTNIDPIDKDHQHLIRLHNRISRHPVKDSALEELIEEIVHRFENHIAREETIMEVCNFPRLEPHKADHRKTSMRLRDLAEDYRAVKDGDSMKELNSALRTWLFEHVIKTDTDIATYAKPKMREIRAALDNLE